MHKTRTKEGLIEYEKEKKEKKKLTKYETHVLPFLDLIRMLKRDGYEDQQIFTKLGISKTQWLRYKKECVELADALKEELELTVAKIDKTLIQEALGLRDDVKTVYKRQLNPVTRQYEMVEMTREVTRGKPNLGALIFMAKNLTKKTGKYLDVNYIDRLASNNVNNEELKELSDQIISIGKNLPEHLKDLNEESETELDDSYFKEEDE